MSTPLRRTLGRLRPRRRLSPSGVERFVGGNTVEFVTDSGRGLELMLEAIVRAQHDVRLEMYWMDSDSTGRRFFDALRDAAKRGVATYVMYDALGSFATESHLFDELRGAGAQVLEFNPLRPIQLRARLSRLTVRNHRKLLVVDGAIAFIGGVNLADQWISMDRGGEGWRDDLACTRGPILADLCESFADSWYDESGQRVTLPMPSIVERGEMQVALLAQAGYAEKRQALEAYVQRIWQAREQVWIANAYFIPNLRLRRALRQAARRGVDVRVLLPARSDVGAVRLASRATWKTLLASGVRIYEYLPSMLHQKTAVIDHQWATTGSFNLDAMSVRNNRELNLSVLDEHFAALVSRAFAADLEKSREVHIHEFQSRPVADKLAERVLYWFRRWL